MFAIGWFSVSADRQVEFATGNLQYHTGDEVFRFAPHQYDTIGEANINLGDPAFKGWIDMFAWSTTSTYFGVSPSNKNTDYTGSFRDWGQVFPGERWYTLSEAEWTYVAKSRPNANKLWALAEVDGIFGYLLLPDDWQKPDGVPFQAAEKPTEATGWELVTNKYTIAQWETLEASGAAFFPAAGRRTGGYGNLINYNQVEETDPAKLNGGYYRWQSYTNTLCYYWTSTMHNTETRTICYMLNEVYLGNDEYDYAGFGPGWYEKGRYGQSVRLARERDIAPAAKQYGPKQFSVSANKKVYFATGNLQYNTESQTWRIAPHQYDVVGAANINIGDPSYKGWLDMFAWSVTSVPYGLSPSNKNTDYSGDFIDWGGVFPDVPAYTLSKAEWDYILKTRPNAAKKIGQAMVGNMRGTIILPDEWTDVPGVTFVPGELSEQTYDDDNDYIYQPYGDVYYNTTKNNVYTLQEWAKLEAAGAVFLPNAGRRAGGYGNYTNYHQETVADMYRWQDNIQTHGYYWTSTMANTETRSVYYLLNLKVIGKDKYNWDQPQPWTEMGRYGQSVRLAFPAVNEGDTIRYTYKGNTLYYKVFAKTDGWNGVKLVNDGNQPTYPYQWKDENKPTGKVVIPNEITDWEGTVYPVRSIEQHVFQDCTGITEVDYSENTYLTATGEYAFRGCTGLTKVTLSDYINTISNYSFADAPLTEIDLKNVQQIFGASFYASDIASVHIPKSVSLISDQTYLFLHATTITCDAENAKFMAEGNMLYTKDQKQLISLPCGMTSGELHVAATADTAMYRAMENCQATIYLNSAIKMYSTYGTGDDRNSPKGDVVVPCDLKDYYSTGAFAEANGNFGNIKSLKATLFHSVEASAGEHGSVAIKDTTDCSKVRILATPDEHYVFDKWSNGLTTTEITLDVDGDTAVVAAFKPAKYTITFWSSDAKTEKLTTTVADYNTSVMAAADFAKGKLVTPECGRFNKWSSDNLEAVQADEDVWPVWTIPTTYTVTFKNRANDAVISEVTDVPCEGFANPPVAETGYIWQWESNEYESVKADLIIYGSKVEDPASCIEGMEGSGMQMQKILRNGNLYILIGGKMFDATGKEVK